MINICRIAGCLLGMLGAPSLIAGAGAQEQEEETLNTIVEYYCVACHNDDLLTAGISFEHLDVYQPELHTALVEKMIKKLRAGMMPPRDMLRPEGDELQQLIETLEQGLDDAAKGRGPGARPFQRVNRAEYTRLVHDMLGLTIDPAEWLPEDQISASFDNIADVQTVSPTLMASYLTAASEIARMAVGQGDAPATTKTWSNPPSVSQHEWERVEGAPYGTRGGISILHTFPADGDYILSMSFISGWGERFHDIDISINGEQVALLEYGGGIDFQGRKKFPFRTDPIFIRAGEQRISVAFVRQTDGPYEDLIRPNDWSLTGTEASYGTTSPPHLVNLTLAGPYNPVGVSDTPARKQIFSCRPTSQVEEEPCAETIVVRLAAKAYGRTPDADETGDLMAFYRLGQEDGGFEVGIRTALEAVLSSPYFLFRIEREPARTRPGDVYKIADLDLAKRLSLFLWGTNPDDELLALAQSGKLSRSSVLKAQAKRMLADPRSESLATRFASLWLQLQDLPKVRPDRLKFPNYSQQLMTAMNRETELFFDYLVREDRSFLELFSADYTFVNERLARHYGIPDVYGDTFRRVKYPDDRRQGILSHGSILVLTSLGNRTSPVLRGKYVMSVLIGTPPPPPPPGVPDLEETVASVDGKILTTRMRMEMHREDPICAACHNMMDPIGLALDNFDVTGKWRIRENGSPLDTRSVFYDGDEVETLSDLVNKLLQRPVPLVRTFTEKLMSYALGRRVEPEDQPVVRKITAAAEQEGYRMSSFILGVIMNDAFRKKESIEMVLEDQASNRKAR